METDIETCIEKDRQTTKGENFIGKETVHTFTCGHAFMAVIKRTRIIGYSLREYMKYVSENVSKFVLVYMLCARLCSSKDMCCELSRKYIHNGRNRPILDNRKMLH